MTSANEPAELLSDGTVTVAGLRAEFGIGRSVAYKLMSEGKLPYTALGTRRLIPRAGVRRLLAENLTGVEVKK